MAFPLPGAGGPTTSLREMARRPTGQGPPPSAPNMFRLNQCTRNFTFLARSSLLFTGIFCIVISTVTPFFISLHCSAALLARQFTSVPQKGKHCKLAAQNTVGKNNRPEMARRSRVGQERRRGSRVLLGHYATSSKAFLVLSSLQSKVYSRGAQLSARSRPFNEHFKLCLLWCSKNSCCKGDRPAAAFKF